MKLNMWESQEVFFMCANKINLYEQQLAYLPVDMSSERELYIDLINHYRNLLTKLENENESK